MAKPRPSAAPLSAVPVGLPGTKPDRLPGRDNVRVRGSGVHGRGLFAARAIRKGERIIQYLGHRITKAESERRTDRQWDVGRVYTFELNKRWDIDGSPPWNVARLANHSCDPNAESQNERGRAVWIVALRGIAAGEEITYDYGFAFVAPPPVCKCGAKSCRGYIVGEEHVGELNEWLRADGRPPVPV